MSPTPRSVNEFDVFTCPLDGTQLIEASAGTGKTWNLCGLYLRLLLERGLEVQRILVVTFTNAATAELRERIRQRIVDTLAHLRGRAMQAGDSFVPQLVQRLRSAHGLTDEAMRVRLELALATFDEASIFTIHGFCQRALADTPLAAQMPLAMELLQDDTELLREAANDFWRRRIAGDELDPALAAYLSRRKDSPEKLTQLVRRHIAKPTATALWPRDIDTALAVDSEALAQAHGAARALWRSDREAIIECVMNGVPALKQNIYKPESIEASAAQWDEWLRAEDGSAALHHAAKRADLLGQTKLRQSTRKSQTTPSHPFFDAAQALLDILAQSELRLMHARLRLLRDLQHDAAQALREAKRRRRVIGFDDMLSNLHERLTGDAARALRGSLKAHYPAALIDEFQDTDPLQFAIFQAIYGAGDAPLFLVGDPKQAIYSFRNADLHTYLHARSQARAEYTLAQNQRSTAPLLSALNALFGANPRAFMLPGLGYRPVALGSKPRPVLVDTTLARAALQVWTLPFDAAANEPLLKADARQAAAQATASEIARLLGAAQRGEIQIGGTPLRAGDIAVLVRSHVEGSVVRQALAQLGVASVELSRASVFRSPDAEELERVLAAAIEPTREKRLLAALASEAMGLDAGAIEALAADPARLLANVQRFAEYRDSWARSGVGVMLRQWLSAEQVAQRLLARPDGQRRLTNLLHLMECLNQAAQVHPTPDALLRWFQAQRRDDRSEDASQLRLESDQNLVQIITIHKSKGLEYGIVFCPFLWTMRAAVFRDPLEGTQYHDDAGHAIIDYREGLDDEYDKPGIDARVKLEACAESLRLIYVALTRAVHRCVLIAGCYRAKAGAATSTKESTHSLLNWLVAGAGESPQDWFEHRASDTTIAAAWEQLAARNGPQLRVEPLPQGAGTLLRAARVAPEMLAALPAPPHIPAGWWIGSYSSLTYGASHEQAAADHDTRAASATALAVDPFDAPSNAPPAAPAGAALDEADILRFPRGAAAGACLHAVFERIDFTQATSWPGAIASALRQLRAGMRAPGSGLGAPAGTLPARMLQRLLADVLNTPLPLGTPQALRLSSLPLSRRLTEMEFHLPAHRLEAAALNETLARLGYPAPQLGFTALRGFLKGFIDLVFEHEGRYFILDWKSNHLGNSPADYAAAPLAAAMAEHGYHLQALLYSVALDRHLRRCLPGYRVEQHFGGVLYLFVRGVRPGWLTHDGRPTGVHFQRPTPEAIGAVSAVFEAAQALA